MQKNIEVNEREDKLDYSKAILVGVCLDSGVYNDKMKSLAELELLAQTAGIKTMDKQIQRRKKISARYFLGKGFMEEITNKMKAEGIGLLIFDNELNPSQGRNIGEDFAIRVIDRTEIILRIFSDHAQTKEAKLQVRKALLEYELPRLKNRWLHFEKQRQAASSKGAGMAARGMGEKQSEIDRRRIKDEIASIRKSLEKIMSQHQTQAKKRNQDFKKMCLVGYTNAGKSTLFNLLTDAGAYVKNKLFATLDTTSKSINFGKGKDMIISDTIGFVANLPHHLVASFRATLKEVLEADLLIHVVDVSDEQFTKHIEDVQEVLNQIGAIDIKSLIVFNKIDKIEETKIELLKSAYPKAIFISARKGWHSNELKEEIDHILNFSRKRKMKLPHSAQKELSEIHELAKIYEKKYLEDGVSLLVEMNNDDFRKFEKYATE